MNRRRLRLLSWTLCLCLSTAVWADNDNGDTETNGEDALDEPPEVQLVRRGSDHQGEMLAARFPDEAQWLEAEGVEFLALEKRETTPGRQGAAVILAGSGQSPAAGLAAGIREHLPAGGWRTLAFSTPESPLEALPARVFPPKGSTPEPDNGDEEDVTDEPNGEDNGNGDDEPEGDPVAERGLTIDVLEDEETVDEDRLGDFQASAMARVEAAVMHLREQGFENIALIGIGEGADIMTRYAEQNHLQFQPRGLGLIWVAPRFREPLDGDVAEFLGPNWPVSILDLEDSRARHDRGAPRRDAARRAGLEDYTQQRVPLSRALSTGSQKRVAYRIRGWLTQNMLGMER